jgi:hypothetical protein
MKRDGGPRSERFLSPVRGSKRSLIDVLSIGLVGSGVLLWILPIQILRGEVGQVIQANTILNLLVLIFMATQLTTVGVAFYAYSLSQRRAVEKEEEVDSTLDRLERLLSREKRPGFDPLQVEMGQLRRPPERISRLHVMVVVETILVLMLYGWLVVEFQSNVYMQNWVRANVAGLEYVLNYSSLSLLLGILFGVLVTQLRPHRPAKP